MLVKIKDCEILTQGWVYNYCQLYINKTKILKAYFEENVFSYFSPVSLLQEIAARVNQSALEAVTPSPSFQQRHESMRPTV